ncbi:MAG TPA: hypothetical protein VKV25_01950, partial [Acidimicrobiales bacterium]|nr:hypothetical protein [Acidimicrobiales bacterium]
DRLDASYHPNSSFSVHPPVYSMAYKAAAAGKLAPGVRIRPEAAAPVILGFSSIPDDDLRAMVAPVAKAGAESGDLAWVGTMRERARQRHKTMTPTPAQVAEEFVETVVERKHRLRGDFVKFFASLGLDATHLEVA